MKIRPITANKNNFLKSFLSEISFFLILLLLLLAVRSQIGDTIQGLRDISPQLDSLQQTLQQEDADTKELELLLKSLESSTTKAYSIIFLTPIIIILIWCLFQAYSFSKIQNTKFNKEYVIRFSIISVISYILILLINYSLIGNYEAFYSFDRNLLFSFFTSFITFHLTFSYYSLLQKDKIWTETLKSIMKIPYKKQIYLIITNFIHFLSYSLILIILSTIFVTYTFKEQFWFSYTTAILFILILILFSTFLKLFSFNILKNTKTL